MVLKKFEKYKKGKTRKIYQKNAIMCGVL